jgi:hypothetical protein
MVQLDIVGNSFSVREVALFNRGDNLFIARRLELIRDDLELGRFFGVCAGHRSKHGIKFSNGLLYLCFEFILRGLVKALSIE